MIVSFDVNSDFWKTFPQFETIEEFSKIKSLKNSSKIMWAIAMFCEPDSSKNIWANIPSEERKEKLKSDFLKSKVFTWDSPSIDKAVSIYKQLILTQAKRSLIAWRENMEDRDNFLKKQKYSLDSYDEDGNLIKGNAEQLDKMHSRTAKFYDELSQIEERLEEEEAKQKTGKGNKILSMSDSDSI